MLRRRFDNAIGNATHHRMCIFACSITLLTYPSTCAIRKNSNNTKFCQKSVYPSTSRPLQKQSKKRSHSVVMSRSFQIIMPTLKASVAPIVKFVRPFYIIHPIRAAWDTGILHIEVHELVRSRVQRSECTWLAQSLHLELELRVRVVGQGIEELFQLVLWLNR